MLKEITCIVGLLGLTLASCAADDDPGAGAPESAAESAEEIRNGAPVTPTTDAVVQIVGVGDNGKAVGTGTMITPEWILTAAHVVEDYRLPSTITVRWGNRSDASAQARKALAVYHHPKALKGMVSGAEGPATDPDVVDIALIRVDKPFTQAITRSISTASTPSFLGTSLYCLGYGLTSDGGSTGTLTAGLLPLVSAFENYAEVSQSLFGSQIPLGGDSGGPCIDLTFASLAIVGVISAGNGITSSLAPAPAFRGWVNEIIDNCSDKEPNTSDFCTTECPCTYGSTDCDETAGCGPGLTCDFDVGDAFGRNPTWSVCVASECASNTQGGASYCDAVCLCGHGGGDCDKDAEGRGAGAKGQCMGGLTCEDNIGAGFNMRWDFDVCVNSACAGRTLGASGFCSTGCRCGYGGGDCNSDSECMPGYKCANDYGAAFDTSSRADICVKPECLNRTPNTSGFCTDACPCGHGGGNCNDDSDCMPWHECGTDNGADFGLPRTTNVCVRKP